MISAEPASRAMRRVACDGLDDAQLVGLARAGEPQAFRVIMQRHNRRLYRVARGILGEDAEAEDAVQEAYLSAFRNLDGFRGQSSLSTWLTRIAINAALERKRQRRPLVGVEDSPIAEDEESRVLIFPGVRAGADPEHDASRTEARRMIERAMDSLPEAFRIVFVMRDVEGWSTQETASHLSLKPETVKTRLHRARRLLREAIEKQIGSSLRDAYGFAGARCERLTGRVLAELGMELPADG